jgi:hypothetical protein
MQAFISSETILLLWQIKKKSIETRGIRISEDGYKKILEAKKIILDLGLRKNIHIYEIVDEALEMYLWHLKKLYKFAGKKE